MTKDKKFSLLRIAFGMVWGIDAALKWQPSFRSGFLEKLTSAWASLLGHDPYLFAILVALAETAIALCLIFNLFARKALIASIMLSLLIWIATGFGGPYDANSTDIGASIMYAFVAFALYSYIS